MEQLIIEISLTANDNHDDNWRHLERHDRNENNYKKYSWNRGDDDSFQKCNQRDYVDKTNHICNIAQHTT